MSEHQRETDFLRHCISYDESPERQKLDARLTQILRDERCVRRAVWLMSVLSALALASLCFAAFLTENISQDTSQLIIKVISALGLACMICLVAFVGLRLIYRMKLDQRREECRQLVTSLLESRLGKPVTKRRRPALRERAGSGNHETVPTAAGGDVSPRQTASASRG